MKTNVVPQMLVCVLMFTVPASLGAQSATPAAAGQAAAADWKSVKTLRVGENVEVVLTDGTEVRGSVIDVTDTSLAIRKDKMRQDIPSNLVVHVERRGKGMLLGGLIGLGGGLAVGLPFLAISNNEGGGSGPLVLIPAGVGAGLLVDHAFNRTHVIYDVPRLEEFRRLLFEAKNGQTVVVTDSSANVTRGKVESTTSNAFEVKTGSNVVRFEQGDVTLSHRKTGTWKGLVIGAAAGAGLGVLRARNTRSAFRDPVQNALIGSGIGGGIGAVFGKLLGADEFRMTYRPR
jgi:RNase P/RNase MRP subunit p29